MVSAGRGNQNQVPAWIPEPDQLPDKRFPRGVPFTNKWKIMSSLGGVRLFLVYNLSELPKEKNCPSLVHAPILTAPLWVLVIDS